MLLMGLPVHKLNIMGFKDQAPWRVSANHSSQPRSYGS